MKPHPFAVASLVGLGLIMTGCSTQAPLQQATEQPVDQPQATERATGTTPVYELPSIMGNRPYRSGTERYTVLSPQSTYHAEGIAVSFQASRFGKKAVNGETINPKAFIAGHRQLSLPAYVMLTRQGHPGYVVVRVIDRGPFPNNQGEIMLSPAALNALGISAGEKTTVQIDLIHVSPTGQYQLPKVAQQPDASNDSTATATEGYIQIMASTDFKQLQQQGQRISQETLLPHRLIPGKTTWRLVLGPIDPAELTETLQRLQHDHFPEAFPVKEPL